MFRFALAVLLPLGVIFYGSYSPYLWIAVPDSKTDSTGKLEKLIVAGGNVTLEIDLPRLNGIDGRRKEYRVSSLRFDAARDSFFKITVFNGELRGPMPGTLPLVAKNGGELPAKLNGSLSQLVLENTPSGDEYDLVIRDAKSGFTFFGVVSYTFDYDAVNRVLSIQNGKLVISKELAAELGRPSEGGAIVGSFSADLMMKLIEVSEIVDSAVTSDILPALGDPEAGSVPGPDVVVGDLVDLQQFGNSSGTRVGLAVGTDSCNFGTVDLNWLANPNNDHPVIPQNLYRMSGGAANDERFEQIGQSNVKHAFEAFPENICGLGCNGVGGTRLGSGCSDPYSASLNAGSSGNSLGSRAWINPFTGFFPRNDSATPNNSHTGHAHNGTSHRVLTESADLNTALNPGATYYAEAQYITPHEYTWCQANPTQCNMYNNVSYRRFNVNGTTCANNTPACYAFAPASPTVRMQPAVAAWPGSTRIEFRPDPGNDGIGFVSYKATNPSPGVWHYEYAVYNQNLDRAIQSFAIPLSPGTTLSNIGFHAPPQQPGWTNDGTAGNTGYSGTPWTQTQATSSITWNTETLAQNANANAIRWGTLYNFRFDSNKPPAATNATIGFFKTGSPITVLVMAPVDPVTNLTLSGRVLTPGGLRGLGIVKITLSDGVNPPRFSYTNSFGFYRFENVTSGASYTITAFKLHHTFSPKQMAIIDNLSNINFVSGQ